MIAFRQFGKASIVVSKIFGCIEDEDGGAVAVFADQGTVMHLSGEDARQFIRFRKEVTPELDEPTARTVTPALTSPRPAQDEARKTASP